MVNEQTEERQKLEQFFSQAYLATLPDPYHVFSKVVEYYAGLTVAEKTAFEDATMDWLRIETTDLTKAQRLRLSNGIRVCGYLKLTRAVEMILVIAQRFAPLRDKTDARQYDLPTAIVLSCVGNLASIGDPRAIGFLKEEASHCGDLNPNRANIAAIDGLSEIDLDAALDFLPTEIQGDMQYRENRSWVDKEVKQYGLICLTLLELLRDHGQNVVPKIAQRLRSLDTEHKRFALESFRAVMERKVIGIPGGHIRADQEKANLVKQFAEDLGLASE